MIGAVLEESCDKLVLVPELPDDEDPLEESVFMDAASLDPSMQTTKDKDHIKETVAIPEEPKISPELFPVPEFSEVLPLGTEIPVSEDPVTEPTDPLADEPPSSFDDPVRDSPVLEDPDSDVLSVKDPPEDVPPLLSESDVDPSVPEVPSLLVESPEVADPEEMEPCDSEDPFIPDPC